MFSRNPGLRIIRQLLHTGQGAFTTRRDVIEGVAAVFLDDDKSLTHLGLEPDVYRRSAVQTAHELCSQGGDSMRVAGATAGGSLVQWNCQCQEDCFSKAYVSPAPTACDSSSMWSVAADPCSREKSMSPCWVSLMCFRSLVLVCSAGIVLSLLRILDSEPPPRMQHAVLRALHNLCQHSLPRTQLATSGGIPSLLDLIGMGMKEGKWVPRQKYDVPVGQLQKSYHGGNHGINHNAGSYTWTRQPHMISSKKHCTGHVDGCSGCCKCFLFGSMNQLISPGDKFS